MKRSAIRKQTAGHEEIIAGMKVATEIAEMIRKVNNPVVQEMIKKMIALFQVPK